MRPGLTRRRALAAGALIAVSGCLDQDSGTGNGDSDPNNGDEEPPDDPPTAEAPISMGHSAEELLDQVVSGGVPRDGIPSIDDPVYTEAGGGDAPDDDEIVFGVEIDGDARAYPRQVLVYHEIVNTEAGGEQISVTYCPLTGTAQGFYRGDTEFGVSGRLVNSNLIIYDRESDSWWPQVPAVAIDGVHTGHSLQEFPVTWTTWGQWREQYPETQVLTEDTGHVRDYGADPYNGGYNPRTGYYEDGSPLFAPLVDDDRHQAKAVFICARTPDGPLAIKKSVLREESVVEPVVDGQGYLAVYDPRLDTGYVYANPDGRSVEYADGELQVDGTTYAPDELPLDRALRLDAMWFAWSAIYPDTEVYDQ